MTFDRSMTTISVAVAVVASLAATVQSYVSWKGRNDPLTSAILAEIAKDCHDIALDAGNSTAKDIPSDYIRQMLVKADSLDLLVNAIEPPSQFEIRKEVEKFLDEEFDRAIARPGTDKQEVEFRFMGNMRAKCTEIIKKAL